MFALHLRTKKRLEFWQVEKNTDRPSWANQDRKSTRLNSSH